MGRGGRDCIDAPLAHSDNGIRGGGGPPKSSERRHMQKTFLVGWTQMDIDYLFARNPQPSAFFFQSSECFCDQQKSKLYVL